MTKPIHQLSITLFSLSQHPEQQRCPETLGSLWGNCAILQLLPTPSCSCRLHTRVQKISKSIDNQFYTSLQFDDQCCTLLQIDDQFYTLLYLHICFRLDNGQGTNYLKVACWAMVKKGKGVLVEDQGIWPPCRNHSSAKLLINSFRAKSQCQAQSLDSHHMALKGSVN